MNNEKDVELFETVGFSMWPFIKQNQKVIIRRTAIRDIDVGDIVLYQGDKQLICHRIIRKKEDNGRYLLYSRGDNSVSAGELISSEMLLGKAIGVLKKDKAVIWDKPGYKIVNRLIVLLAPWFNRAVRIARPYYALILRRN